MSKKNEQGIVIGTKDEAFWTEILKSAKAQVEDSENQIKLSKEIMKIAQNKILLEKRK